MPEESARAPIVLIASSATDSAPLARALREDSAAEQAVLSVTLADDDSIPAAMLAAGLDGARFVFLARDERESTPGELADMDTARWCRIERPRLLADPRAELTRICEFTGIAYDQARLTPIEAAARATRSTAESEQPSPFASISTSTFGEAIRATAGSLLVSRVVTSR